MELNITLPVANGKYLVQLWWSQAESRGHVNIKKANMINFNTNTVSFCNHINYNQKLGPKIAHDDYQFIQKSKLCTAASEDQ